MHPPPLSRSDPGAEQLQLDRLAQDRRARARRLPEVGLVVLNFRGSYL